ncbi:MAG: magnesium transporter [Clostridia bacterium]|nr:magnesium transporter [Clostridia bacterium]
MYRVEFDEWKLLLEAGKLRTVAQELSSINEADVADFLEEVSPTQTVLLFRLFEKDRAAAVFSFLDSERRTSVVRSFTDSDLGALVDELYLDDAADFLEELPAGLVKRVLKAASGSTRDALNRLLNYPEDSTGSIMTAEYIDLRESITAEAALERVRKLGLDSETAFVCYCTDETRHLIGVLDLLDLLYADSSATVGEIMNRNVIFARTTDDREAAAQLISKYDFLALPVVDKEERLVGIVTFDDAMDVVTEEATEDIERMAALLPSDTTYLKTSVFAMYRNRILWLLFLMFSGMISGFVLGGYEAVLAALPLLVTFTPMLTGTGGNAGAQSATLVIRGMSLSQIEMKHWLQVLWKEVRVGFLVGLTLGAFNYARVLLFYPGEPQRAEIALVLAISVLLTVVLSKSVGCLLPIAAHRVGLDPAVMASPLVTTIVDSLSLLIFLSIASAVLV